MSIANEGGVYLCNWKNAGKRFEIHVVGKEKWVAIGNSFGEAELRLTELISDDTGDLQPCLEYQISPPKQAVHAKFDGGVVGVSGANDPLDFIGNAEQLFTDGICEICKFGRGERTNVPLTVRHFPSGSDAGFVRARLGGPFGNMNLQIYSEQFIQNLHSEEKQRFLWIPTEADQKSEQKFFEPNSVSPIPLISPKGLFSEDKRLQPDGFHCRGCGRTQLAGIPQGGGGIYSFISEAAMPCPVPTCFQIGQPANLHFCMTKERWQSLQGKPGTKRLMSRQIGVAKRNSINSHPKLQFLE